MISPAALSRLRARAPGGWRSAMRRQASRGRVYSGSIIKIVEKAITQYTVIDQNLGFSHVEMRPITARKHQLRKQSSIIGHPIVGDKKYTFLNKSNKLLMLHAFKIKFLVNKKKINYIAKIPKHFNEFCNSKKINLSGYLKS